LKQSSFEALVWFNVDCKRIEKKEEEEEEEEEEFCRNSLQFDTM
jgi:hypothetical protein